MRLAVNIDHFATLREARKSTEPDPVLAALLAEQAGAEGIVCHLRTDRRHIQERDVRVLREAVKTKLNVEMAATEDMLKTALRIGPDVVSLVPERPEELTTEGGLDVTANRSHLGSVIRKLRKAGIRVSIFIDPHIPQIGSAEKLGVDLIEINTGRYADLKPGIARDEALAEVREAAEYGRGLGLEVHAGHGLDYRNVRPIVAVPEVSELSIGFSIIARAAIVGIEKAVREMRKLLERQ
jgi:pyridoxine 5-phosphate synthase